jgi:hypothetical protein
MNPDIWMRSHPCPMRRNDALKIMPRDVLKITPRDPLK